MDLPIKNCVFFPWLGKHLPEGCGGCGACGTPKSDEIDRWENHIPTFENPAMNKFGFNCVRSLQPTSYSRIFPVLML